MSHIYDPEPVTDESTLTIADLRNAMAAYALTVNAEECDRLAAFLDAYIQRERQRLGLALGR